MWFIIDDKKIRHKWECPDCDAHANVEPWYYSEMGEPYCVDCEREMEYIHTEMNNG